MMLLTALGAASGSGVLAQEAGQQPPPDLPMEAPAVIAARARRPQSSNVVTLTTSTAFSAAARSISVGLLQIGGEVAGEALHFGIGPDGTFESLAAVPIEAEGSLDVTVTVTYEAGRVESLESSVPIVAGDYRHERLTVAPEYGSPPDSAAQARLERDRAKAREVSRQAHQTRRLWTPDLVIPRDDRVTSGFGDGREFNGQISSRHMGLDLDGEPGDTVVAVTRGVVALVDEFLLAGNIVYLNHGGGLLSGYFHLSEQLVAAGDTVDAGTPIGRVGATGRVTGPHLHWVVRYGRTSVDPRSLLELGR